jgi:hypothetical protein
MAYGRPARVLARALSFTEATVAYAALCLLLYGLVPLKAQLWHGAKRDGNSGNFGANAPVST